MSENLCASAYFVQSDNGRYLSPCKSIQDCVEHLLSGQNLDVFQRVGPVGKYYEYLFTISKKDLKGGDCNGLS